MHTSTETRSQIAMLAERPEEIVTFELVTEAATRPRESGSRFGFVGRWVGGIGSALEWCFGLFALMIGLAVLAAIPVVQFLSLGYLLESGARVARTGRLRDGFIGVRIAARLGAIVAATWLTLLPVRFISDLAKSAETIAPGSATARNGRVVLAVFLGLTILHLLASCARGGRLRTFLWPFNVLWLARRLCRKGWYSEWRDAVWQVYASLRLPYYFWLGLRGFAVAFLWLIVPVSLLALGHYFSVIGFVGALALAWVLLDLPFLQMRMAVENRFRAGLERKAAKAEFARAPWIASLAVLVTLLTSLPLYLLKIELVPAEAAWLPSLVFVMFLVPARLLTGWAMSWARSRTERRHAFFRWTGRLALLPGVAFYVLIVYFTQFTSWHGIWSLFEQHAFLLPAPFLGL